MSMLTYQLQRRAFHILEKGKTFSFPNTVEVEVIFEPTEMFGVGKGLTKTFVSAGQDLRFQMNPDTMKCGIEPDHLFDPIEAIMEWTDINQRFEMHGNKLIAKHECKDINDLTGFLAALHYILPLLFSIEFLEPPIVKSTVGKVGDVPFRWEFAGYRFGVDITDKETQEKRIIDSFDRLSFGCAQDNRRLTAALFYFYTAKRLKDAGYTNYEFMPEVVLNYCKALEVLFTSNKGLLRRELLKLGYSEADIADKFMPILELRNGLDIGHATVSVFNQEQLTILYEYLEDTEHDLRELLKTVLKKVQDESYKLKRDTDFEPDKDKRKIVNKIVNIQEKRNKQGIKSQGTNGTNLPNSRGNFAEVRVQQGLMNNIYIYER
jgi:hypothetical protein